MPVVTIDWWSGSEPERRRELIGEVTATVSRIADCPADAVTVIVRDVERTHWGKGGVPATDL